MIRYLIVDDEYVAHDIIKSYCNLLPDMQLVKQCYDALEAFEYLNRNTVDLIFLDLNMPVLKGFDFLRTLKTSPKVIVTTAHSEFALDGYDYNISDYLLKPFSFERFLKSINKAFSNGAAQRVSSPEGNCSPDRIFIQHNKKHIQLAVDQILYIEATGNYIKIVLVAESITIREKISVLIEQLPKTDFLQVHKSFAVAVKHIRSIDGNRIFIADHVIPVGKMFRFNIDQLLKRD